MTEHEAEMWAEVAQRIGWRPQDDRIEAVEMSDGTFECCAIKEHPFHTRYMNFDPPTNPADERLLWEWLAKDDDRSVTIMRPIRDDPWADPGYICMIHDETRDVPLAHETDICRVTALGLAIARLPE